MEHNLFSKQYCPGSLACGTVRAGTHTTCAGLSPSQKYEAIAINNDSWLYKLPYLLFRKIMFILIFFIKCSLLTYRILV